MGGKRKYIAAVLALILLASFAASGCARRGGGASERPARTTSRGRESSDRADRGRPTEEETTAPAAETAPVVRPSPQTVPETTEGLVFDDRRAGYPGTAPEWELMHLEWQPHYGTGTVWMEFYVDKAMYRYYCSLDHYATEDKLYLFATDENNRELIRSIIDIFRKIAGDQQLDDAEAAKEIAKFVQDTIEYQLDIDSTGESEYFRYPIETLYEQRGDCEDTSILMASLLREWGFEVGLLLLPRHCAVAIRAADDYDSTGYYEINGRRYLYIESTGSGWEIGNIPEEMLEYGAQLYLLP